MPASSKKSCLAVLRSVAEITQKQLAQMVGCAPVTVQSIELGKLRLSQRLARRIALQTGVSINWLLQNDYKVPPTCDQDAGQPYTKRVYELTRAEISDPRTDLVDVVFAQGVVANAAHKLAGGLLTAYRRNQTVFFYYKLREFLEDFRAEFPPATDLDFPQPLDKVLRQLRERLGQAAESKKRHQRRDKATR